MTPELITPPKPSVHEFEICKLGNIHGVHIKQLQTGTDTADTFVTITGSNGSISQTLWSNYRDLIRFEPGRDWVASVNKDVWNRVDCYNIFVRTNASELVLYERLKKKFEAKSNL